MLGKTNTVTGFKSLATDTQMSDSSENAVQNKVIKSYVDSIKQDIIKDYMDADTNLQTQITGLSNVIDEEQEKITSIENKIPTNASSSNLLSTANDLLNATQDVRADFTEADSDLQTQINAQATAVTELQDDVMSNLSEIADLREIVNNIETGGGSSGGSSITVDTEISDTSENPVQNKVVKNYIDTTKQDTLISGTNIKTINGENIIGSGDIEIKSGGSGRNVGDIFYTTRQDSELNGAVECNGATYNIGDFTGAESISDLLLTGKIMSVPFFQYEMSIEERGYCEYFAFDGNETFRVPTLPTVILASNQAPVVGNGMALGLTDGTKDGGFTSGAGLTTSATGNLTTLGKPVGTAPTSTTASNKLATNVAMGVTTDPNYSGIVANLDTIAVEYRAMVQLANEATDEAVITATNALVEINRLSQSLNEINAELENFAKIDGSNYANSSLEDIVNDRIVMTTITYLE